MSPPARDVLEQVRRELTPAPADNRLVPRIADGTAPRSALAEFAAQQFRVLASDRRSLLVLAARAADTPAGGWFAALAAGESHALAALDAFAAACGPGADALRQRPPLPGCQAYPAFVCWLAVNGEPGGTVLALAANFAAWGAYCATTAAALRRHYGFDDEACAFFDFFAEPAPELERQTVDALEALGLTPSGIDRGRGYGRLLQSYESMFWNTLADAAGPSRARGGPAPGAR